MNRPVILGFVLFLVVFLLLLFAVKRRVPEESVAVPQMAGQETQSQEAIRRRINVKLLFNDGEPTQLVAEERSITYEENLHSQVKQVLNELIKGPEGNLVPTIPKGTRLLDLFISKDGIAYADFSSELVTNHQGGSAGEIDTVYSIVNTLTLNFPQIKRVQILVQDQAVETLTGHVDLSHPLRQDLSLLQQERSSQMGKEES
jgi:spore germination protein GerM